MKGQSRPLSLLWHLLLSRPATLLNTTAVRSSELVPRTGNYWKHEQS